MNAIYKTYLDARKKHLASYIEENIIDGEQLDSEGNTYIFMATNGSWQTKYLSLYEMLHDKYIARYCAKLLLEDYLDKYDAIIKALKQSGIGDEELHQRLYQQVAFTKIVTVTVSSQLIGVALRNLIRHDDRYFFLRNPAEQNPLKSSPTLLRLSSYYSFDEEKQFREIGAQDKVVVVNDVISSGKLVYTLSEKLLKKGACINAVFCIADTRVPDAYQLKALKGNHTQAETDYIYGFLDKEAKIFSLVDCYGANNEIRKYERPYTGTAKVKRVNPLLNTIVELETKHSEEKRILFPDPASFLKAAFMKEANFKIGHFRQNLSHNGYLTDMHNLFSTEGNNANGRDVLFTLKERLNKFFVDQPPAIDVLDAMQQNVEWLRSSGEEVGDLGNLTAAITELRKAYKALKQPEDQGYRPDYIFYPPFSGIEQLDEQLLHESFGTPIENVICLQRFDTNKGWRFPFPAKWYNHLTQDKSVLILDSGSLTGESMVQLIDSVSFLDVREITVLCAITRIEDFYREFYSRSKFVKVKKLQTETDDVNALQHIVPLQILFGINLNIPVYPSRFSCPFCEEVRTLHYYQDKAKRTEPSDWTKKYLIDRQDELKEINLEKLEKYEVPTFFPTLKLGEEFNSIDIFLMRDRIGRVDSYRFYKDYFYYFDELKTDIDAHGIYDDQNIFKLELILLIILHEPQLIRTLIDLLGDIRDFCFALVEDLVFNNAAQTTKCKYNWTPYSSIRLAVIFMPARFKKIETWTKAFEFSLCDDRALNYLSFLLWEGFLGESALLSNQEFADITSYYSDKLDDQAGDDGSLFKDKRFRKIIKSITNKYAFSTIDSVNDAYFNLRKFFFSQTSSNSHNELIRSMSRFKNTVENFEKTNADILTIVKLIEQINNFLKDGLMNNLLCIQSDVRLKKFHEVTYQSLLGSNGILPELKDLLQEFDGLIEAKAAVYAEENFEVLENAYLKLDAFYVKYLVENSSFYNYCRGYKAEFTDALLRITSSATSPIKKQLTNGRTLFVCGLEIPFRHGEWEKNLREAITTESGEEGLFLAIHESFLEMGIEEILLNAVKHSEKERIEITIEVEKGEEGLALRFLHSEGGEMSILPEEIKAVFDSFCGERNVHFRNNEQGQFTIELIFNTELLKYS